MLIKIMVKKFRQLYIRKEIDKIIGWTIKCAKVSGISEVGVDLGVDFLLKVYEKLSNKLSKRRK